MPWLWSQQGVLESSEVGAPCSAVSAHLNGEDAEALEVAVPAGFPEIPLGFQRLDHPSSFPLAIGVSVLLFSLTSSEARHSRPLGFPVRTCLTHTSFWCYLVGLVTCVSLFLFASGYCSTFFSFPVLNSRVSWACVGFDWGWGSSSLFGSLVWSAFWLLTCYLSLCFTLTRCSRPSSVERGSSLILGSFLEALVEPSNRQIFSCITVISFLTFASDRLIL